MKIDNKITQRAQRRFKWMCLASLAVLGIHYVIDGGIKQVDAIHDQTFEADDLFSGYIESAKFQKQLMKKQRKDGHQTWTQEDYQRFQARRYQTILAKNSLSAEMQKGIYGWHKTVTDFDNLPEVKPNKNGTYSFGNQTFAHYTLQLASQGYVEEYYDEQRCWSATFNTPGISLTSSLMMGPVYFVFLCYLFLGISISADIFMEAIEVITSKTQVIQVMDAVTNEKVMIEVPIWNPTLANLTLMAFGSSAPEIILSVLEAVKSLGKPQGELGPSTIVGSAAFNLLVISAVSIAAVGGPNDDRVKYIDDMGVFITTSIFSIFAYIWLYVCLAVRSKGEVTIEEASWTLGFFFILLTLAYCADRYNQSKKKKEETDKEQKEFNDKKNKAQLRIIMKKIGKQAVLAAAQGKVTKGVSDKQVEEIKNLYSAILEKDDLKNVSMEILNKLLEPDTLFERFAARKAVQAGGSTEFLAIKGQKFQMEENEKPIVRANHTIGFKCLHYSVTESSGEVKVTITKKKANSEVHFAVRTRDGSAVAGRDYQAFQETCIMSEKEQEKQISIKIFDNDDWQPDSDFYLEIYNPYSDEIFIGDDATCKITILDEDFPGKLSFERTEVKALRSADRVDVKVNRLNGTDGKISCVVRTEPYIAADRKNPANAVEFDDYTPKHETIFFESGENMKIISIELPQKVPEYDNGQAFNTAINADGIEEDIGAPKFKIVLEKALPEAVKISKKNCCTVELDDKLPVEVPHEEVENLIDYFVQQKSPSWGYQFKQSVMLSPQLDQDDLIVEQVTLYQALMHFATMGWKILFAFIPPVQWGNGWPAFIVALAFIGVVTAVVAEVATVFGCTLGIKEAVTAITFVAVGTSLPDTFASKTAASQSQFADSAIGNITGSNSVNVFVGLGLPWLISSMYCEKHGKKFETPPGNLAFSVMLFLITSIICFIVLFVRRYVYGGELGGPSNTKWMTSIFLVVVWLIYVLFSSLKTYEIIEGI